MNRAKKRTAWIALAACGVLGLASVSMLATPGGFPLRACFDDAGGLEAGDPAMIGGVQIGRVVSIGLDGDYRACAELDVDPGLKLSVDTSAAIHTRNVLGARYVALQPGGDEARLAAGDEITFTQSALVVERLIGKLMHGFGDTD